MFVSVGFAAALFIGCASEKCEKCEHGTLAEAKISKETAQATALAKFPGGTVKDGKIDKWKGKSYWSFDIVPATGGEAVEVAVDPNSGKVVWMSNEKEDDEKK